MHVSAAVRPGSKQPAHWPRLSETLFRSAINRSRNRLKCTLSGAWAARNILAEIAGKERTPFDYKDKGIMAMIGPNATVSEMGAHRHEVDGPVAFAAWLGVHAMLLSGVRNKIDAFIAWGWDYFSKNGATAMVGAPEAGRIDWGDDDEGEKPEFDPAPTQSAFTRTW